jgi:hypothetical protein
MGHDACVYCDCYERGRLRTPPPQSELVYVDECGQVVDAPGADVEAFDAWAATACEHPGGELIHHRLGNIALIEFLRAELSRSRGGFPILLNKVVYDGTHCGDHLDLPTVGFLGAEINSMRSLHCEDSEEEELLRTFERQMEELVAASLAVRKPIAF